MKLSKPIKIAMWILVPTVITAGFFGVRYLVLRSREKKDLEKGKGDEDKKSNFTLDEMQTKFNDKNAKPLLTVYDKFKKATQHDLDEMQTKFEIGQNKGGKKVK